MRILKKKLAIAVSFCLGVLAMFSADRWYVDNWRKSQKIKLSSLSQIYRNRLETTIISRFNAIESINALFTIHPNSTSEEFAHFAQIVMTNNPPIRALQYADEKTRVTYVYPPKDNEITISKPKTLLTDPKRGSYVKKAISQRRPTVQGPYELRQGGMGLVVRSPIFIKETFCGLAIGVFDVPALIQGIWEQTEHDNVFFELSDQKGLGFAGALPTGSEVKVTTIKAGDTIWKLAMGWSHKSEAPPKTRWIIWLVGSGIFLFIYSILWVISAQNKLLAQKVAQRTRELREKNKALANEMAEQERLHQKIHTQQIALRHAQKMDSLGTMAGGVAHEFNNILGIILGNVELALDDLDHYHPARMFLEEIKNASLRGREVGRRILLFINRLPSPIGPLNICSVVREALILARHTIPKNIEIRDHILCKHQTIQADPSEITQLLINLITNAFEAVNTESGTIDVTLRPKVLTKQTKVLYGKISPKDYVSIQVADTGGGIEPKIIERMFDPYFSTKEMSQGLGMGLAVVYGIVKKYDGAINVESFLDRGTTIEIFFPLLKTAQVECREDTQRGPKAMERILLVEDEPALLKMLTRMIQGFGYHVTAFADSRKALKQYQKTPDQFDLVITDMAMPALPGDHLARTMLKIRPNMPIIICTGHSDHMDDAKAKEMGIAAYAAKPIQKSELAGLIRAVLNG